MWCKKNTCTLLEEMYIGAATVENGMEVPPKLNIELAYHPVIALLNVYPKERK